MAAALTRSVFSPSYGRLLELLVTTRRQAGVSQAELAQRINRPQPFISYCERGERRIDVIEFYAIMRALGADPEIKFRELVRQLPRDIEV